MSNKIVAVETLRLQEFTNVLWVTLETEDGTRGLGECFFISGPVESYIHEYAAPLLLGEEAGRIEFLRTKLRPYVGYQAPGAEVRGNSAIDIALWDLLGKQSGLPLYQLLGGRTREWIRTYNTCAGYRYVREGSGQRSGNWGLDGSDEGPYEDLDGFLTRADEVAESLLESGITGMKIWPFDRYAEASHGISISPAELREGCEPFAKIRDAVGDDMDIMLEMHSLWSLPAALQIAEAVEPYGVYWIEDPVQSNALSTLADFKQQSGARVTASETIATRQGFRDLMEQGAADIIMFDIGWVGGLSEARAITAMAEAYQLPVAPHDCTGPIGYIVSCHLSVSAPNALIQESVRAFYSGWYKELVTDLPPCHEGMVQPPEGPGLGSELLPGLADRADAKRRISRI